MRLDVFIARRRTVTRPVVVTPNNAIAVRAKVVVPVLSARPEQWNRRGGAWFHAAKIGALEQIAAAAGPAEVIQCVAAAMLQRNDMIDVKRPLVGRIGKAAVLATCGGALPHDFA